MAAINIASITDEAKKRQKELRYLIWVMLMETLGELGINVKNVKGVDVIQEIQRKGGLMRPYVIGTDPVGATELMKLSERELRLKTAYLEVIDNIKNYSSTPIMGNPFDNGAINQTKKHPLEKQILVNFVKTLKEDILDALMFGERNDVGTTPLATFDGFNTIIDDEVTATNISIAKGNLVNTGAIATPAGDSDYLAVNSLVDFVRAAESSLRRYNANFYITPSVYNFAIDALENKKKYKNANINDLETYINEKAGSKVKLIKHEVLGSGTRIMLMQPGNLDFGMDNFSDADFVQVRNIDHDPNIVRFWSQVDLGARINGLHKKVFQVNEQSAVAASISGDY